jgi:uncharacterized protein YndB with AHSA1/START domain
VLAAGSKVYAMRSPERSCLLIADISGYTEYLAGVAIEHAQDILADLIGSVVTSLRPNFRLAKLEGDAAFCFAPGEQIDGSVLLDTIERCYFAFRRRRRDVRQATSCQCDACTRIPDLNLKFVAHHGTVARQKVAGREELMGSDVIVVHRLLKNTVGDALGSSAYALLTDSLVQATGIVPEALGMAAHSETYEHVGELQLWIHDLEARWQEEEARQRIYLGPDEAALALQAEVNAPPQIVWELLTVPGRREVWQRGIGVTGIDQQTKPGGRRGVGMVNHCRHGADASVEEILDWRPFDYFSDRTTMPAGPSYLSTFELEPTTSGTVLHMRFAPARKKDRAAFEQLAPIVEQSIMTAADAFRQEVERETKGRSGSFSEPPLPGRSPAGPLAGLEPIRIVG